MPYCGVALDDLASRWSQSDATAKALRYKVR